MSAFSIPIANGHIKALTRVDLSGRTPADPIIALVEAEFRVARELLLNRSRVEWIVWPRQVAMALAYELTPMSSSEVGKRFGRDHNTVLFAVSRVRARCDTEPGTKAVVEKLRAALRT